jgi:hypothetical protein
MQTQDTLAANPPPCSEQVFSQDDRWYFHTQDGAQIGPFRYRSEAQSGLEKFLEELKNKL